MTINIDLTNPINAVRAVVGDVDVCNPIMSDNMYQQILDINTVNGRDECIVLWFASIQAATIIYTQYSSTAQRSRERVGSVEVENYGGERYGNYKNLLTWLRKNPPINCNLQATLFYFGGTYTECSTIYTMRYINSCLRECWGAVWVDGYYRQCS